ncbi:hypothetical protein HELRODRAFT_168291 [Helobdella robusta]|uniref:Tumor suppressor candidate 2 n=1 Tax=Helobdella robusta TaxID=6412 RepID=T1F0E7_HELRO|nr:hypothetical protein HELRODRAFT_168291 [Helobdella robusta]ESO09324.1 hypothetical protein HELRODRAFT_168291 [Helobdella robusta]
MGQITSSLGLWKSNKNADYPYNSSNNSSERSVTPYVYRRRGSMYFDEDGDLAHEFYEEIKTHKGVKMKRVPNNCLIPQGYIKLSTPRLNKDIPIIIHEAKS